VGSICRSEMGAKTGLAAEAPVRKLANWVLLK
jgi:hypothetical protein